METKKDIRTYILAKRNLISKTEWEEKSELICRQVISHPFFLEADEIYCYVDYNQETGTRSLIEKAWELGKKTAVPKVQGNEMQFFYIESFEELEEGYFGIPEPVTEKAANGSNVLVVMPGSAFDEKRNRIGYGKGFYDRYLKQHENYRTIAIAFDFQIVDAIPADAFDIKPDIIITEEKSYV